MGLANAGGLLRGVLVVLAAEEPVAKVQVVLLQTLIVLLRRCVAYALIKKCLPPATAGAPGKSLEVAFENMLMSTRSLLRAAAGGLVGPGGGLIDHLVMNPLYTTNLNGGSFVDPRSRQRALIQHRPPRPDPHTKSRGFNRRRRRGERERWPSVERKRTTPS